MTSKTLQPEQLKRQSENKDFTIKMILPVTSVVRRGAVAPQRVLTRTKQLNHYSK